MADNDYVAVTGSNASFAANNGVGSQTQEITVQVTGDTKVEQNESFTALLSNLTAAGRSVNIVDDQGLATIVNDDSATISIDDVTLAEGDQGVDTQFVFTVTLSNEIDAAISVNYDTAEGTATTADGDFVANTGSSLTFLPNVGTGAQTHTVSVQVPGDNVVELDENFFVDLSFLMANGLDVTISDDRGVGLITNDETASISVDDVTLSEGDVGQQDLIFTVTLDTDVDTGVSINAMTLGSAQSPSANATAGEDFTSVATGLNFSGTAGETQTVTVAVAGDQVVELNEQFFLNLSNILAGGRDVVFTKSSGIGQIANDDAATISIGNAMVTEGDAGTSNLNFTVTLDAAVDAGIVVDYSTSDGTATLADNDYQLRSGSLNFTGSANEAIDIVVPVNGDINVEPDETLFANLLSLSAAGRNVALATSQGTGSIVDDDNVFITISDATIAEGHAPDSSFLIFTVTRSNTTVPVDVNFATSDGTASAAEGDYLSHSGTLSFPAGAPTTANVVVEVIGDHVTELSETLFVDIDSTSFGAIISDGQGQGTITQDDGFITGQKWHDLNDNGVQDGNEPGLNGWTIQVVDPNTGVVAASAVTGSVDLNNDGRIDPITEQGLYSIAVGAGTWNLSEVLQQGWRQTHPNAGDALAFQLDQDLRLRTTGNLFENWGGVGEKWLFGKDGWYFITPVGNLFRWNGSPRTNLSGDFVGGLGAKFHATPSLLFDAQTPGSQLVTVTAGQTTADQNFGNIPTGSVEGRKFHDVNADGERNFDEPYLNGWQVTLRNSAGQIVGTTVTADIDLNGDGLIDIRTERGVYQFERLVPDTYIVSEEQRPNWNQGGSDGLFAGEAAALNQRLNFREPLNDFRNWGGRNEKWLWSNVGWHFVTPDGGIYQWDNSPRTALTGRLVAQFNSEYWQDLSLVYAPPSPNNFVVDITGQEAKNLNFANTFGHDGTGNGDVQLTVTGQNVSFTGDDSSNTVVVYVGIDGGVMATGVGNTTINQSTAAVRLPQNPNLTASLHGGDDQFVVIDTNAAGLNLQSGVGIDSVVLGNVGLGNATISDSHGAGEVRVENSLLGSLNVNSDGLTSVQDSIINGNLAVSVNGTGNTIFVQRSTVSGDTSAATGNAADAVIANNSIFGGNVTVDVGNGNDLVAVRASSIGGDLQADGRGGNDTFGASHNSSVAGSSLVRGGSGSDSVYSDGTSSVGTASSIENTVNSNLDNLIDLALSNFDDLLLDN